MREAIAEQLLADGTHLQVRPEAAAENVFFPRAVPY
jgi:hypothetical protein